MTDVDFRYANLSESKLPDSLLMNNNFDYATLNNINFAGKRLVRIFIQTSHSSWFRHAKHKSSK